MTRSLILPVCALLCLAAPARSDDAKHPRPKRWEGSVAKVGADGRIYITAGSASGLRGGEQLAVRRPGGTINDPRTREVLGRELGVEAGVVEVLEHVNEKLTVCEVVEGRGFRVGDTVSRAREPVGDSGPRPAPAAKPTPPAKPARPADAEAPARPPAPAPARLAPSPTEPKNGKCVEGKFITAATNGKCCWSQQVWSDEQRACIGAPRCPNGSRRVGLECVR